MLAELVRLLHQARTQGEAVGAFNVYNLEGARAVIAAAEAEAAPVILQVHPAAWQYGGPPLLALCLASARASRVPVAVHLDHSTSACEIEAALAAGVTSIMVDGSHLPYADNVAFTREMAALAHRQGVEVEAELGRLSGTEDATAVHEYEAHLTDPDQAAQFVSQTGVDALAVCIGNAHGAYLAAPRLDFERLTALKQAVPTPLVLHGVSGLPESLIHRAIALGVSKCNVNTDLRQAYLQALHEAIRTRTPLDLLDLLKMVTAAMQAVAAAKLRIFQGKEETGTAQV
jgi:tagatose 1,6-diphosphate aldolase GatY/KbaY